MHTTHHTTDLRMGNRQNTRAVVAGMLHTKDATRRQTWIRNAMARAALLEERGWAKANSTMLRKARRLRQRIAEAEAREVTR